MKLSNPYFSLYSITPCTIIGTTSLFLFLTFIKTCKKLSKTHGSSRLLFSCFESSRKLYIFQLLSSFIEGQLSIRRLTSHSAGQLCRKLLLWKHIWGFSHHVSPKVQQLLHREQWQQEAQLALDLLGYQVLQQVPEEPYPCWGGAWIHLNEGLGGPESLCSQLFGSGIFFMSAPWFQPRPQSWLVGATAAAAPRLSSSSTPPPDPTHAFTFHSSVLLYLKWVS